MEKFRSIYCPRLVDDSWSARDQVYEDSRIVSLDKALARLATVRLITLHFISKSVRRMLTVSVQPLSWSTMRTTYHGYG